MASNKSELACTVSIPLTKHQITKLRAAHNKGTACTVRLSKAQVASDVHKDMPQITLAFSEIKRLASARRRGKGVEVHVTAEEMKAGFLAALLGTLASVLIPKLFGSGAQPAARRFKKKPMSKPPPVYEEEDMESGGIWLPGLDG